MFLNESRVDIDRHLVTLVDPSSFGAEQYRRLRQQVEIAGTQREIRVIAVTSAVVSDGKTLTAVNLAGALARQRDGNVLLIDADLRRPAVAEMLGLDSADRGLMAALKDGKGPLAKFVQSIEGTKLSVLRSEIACAETYELLTSPRLTELIKEARSQYTYVIVDTPPIIPVPDSGLLRHVVDGYIVVVSARSTPRKLVGEALNLLEPASVIGLVFNRDDRPLFGYYRSHYGKYFRSYVRSARDS
jgi:capsular exopolysaccharide synthesis family protein